MGCLGYVAGDTEEMWPQLQGNPDGPSEKAPGLSPLHVPTLLCIPWGPLTGGVQGCQRWPGILGGASQSQWRRRKKLAGSRAPEYLARPGLTASPEQGSQSRPGWSPQTGGSATHSGREQGEASAQTQCLPPASPTHSAPPSTLSQRNESLLGGDSWMGRDSCPLVTFSWLGALRQRI